MLKKLYFVLLPLLLAGCSAVDLVTDSARAVELEFTDNEKITEQLRTSQVNLVPLDSLTFRILSLDSINRVDITTKSQAVTLPEGNSYVAAFLLPERISRFTFLLESITGRTVFVPSALFLDEDFQEITRISDAKLIDRKFTLQKSFDEKMTSNVRYIIVYSKDADLDGKTALRDIRREYEEARGKSLSEIESPKPYSKHSPIGNINVTIKDAYFDAKTIKKRKEVKEVKEVKEEVIIMSTAPTVDILNDTEAFYLQQISKAVRENDLPRAKSLTEEAVRAGSTKALSHYMDEIGKLK